MAAPSGTTWGSIVGGYGRIGIYSSVSSTNTTSTVTVEVWFWSKYSVSDTSNTFYYDNLSTAGSATTSRGSVSINTSVDSGSGWSTSNQQKLGSYSYTYNRGTSAVTRYLRAKLANVDRVGGTMTAAAAVSIPKLASYTISYNANGGSGAPSSQTKWYGKSLTLSTTKPTRTGYTFQGWGTSSSTTTISYASGASYTNNASITLYAIWKAITYSVKYNANGGSGAPGNQTKTYGVSLTLSSTKPTRTNYIFKGWGTSSSATTVSYAAGATYTKNAAITLYAIWELGYVKPRISNVSAIRCDSSGVAKDDGTNALISFDWECDKTVSSIVVKWKKTSDTTWTSSTVSASSTSGTVNHVVGSNGLDVESSYDIHITVSDSGGSTYATETLASMKFVIDFLSGGSGIAFGKTAEIEDTAEFEFAAKFNSPVYGNVSGLNKLPSIPENSDLNTYMETGCWAVYRNDTASTITNIPVARAGRLEVYSSTGEGIRSEQWSYLRQRYIPYNITNAIWERDITRSSDNVWTYGEWYRTTLSSSQSEIVYHEQKILWEGARYMTADHTINLSEAVSKQPNGISLVFSKYSDGAAQENNFNSFFVPRVFITSHKGYGNAFTMMDINFGQICHKYLYISDTYITGHANNAATGTGTSGIIYANNKYVLRYVIGV